MLQKLSLLLFTLICFSSKGQDVTATLKTVGTLSPGKDITLEVAVNKPGVSGFMKYFMEIPAGYTATDIDSKGGNFTFADNGAKIIWISPPTADQFTISYKIGVPASATGSISLNGKFSYVVGNERKSFDIPAQTLSVGGAAVAAAEPVKETPKPAPVEEKPKPAEEKPIVKEEPKPAPVEEKPKPVEEKPIVKETPKPAPVEEKPKPVEEKPKPVEEKTIVKETPKPAEPKKETPAPVVKPTEKTPTSAMASSTGKTYRVQIGAFNLKPTINGVPEPSTVQLNNGMTKYFSGNFKTYEEAVKRKNEMVSKGFQGAFIVGFENGKMIK